MIKYFLHGIVYFMIIAVSAYGLLNLVKGSSNSYKKMSSVAASAKSLMEKSISENEVMVFSKSYCPYCTKTKNALEGLGIKYGVLELDVSYFSHRI
jgi:thioredoxin-related protein